MEGQNTNSGHIGRLGTSEAAVFGETAAVQLAVAVRGHCITDNSVGVEGFNTANGARGALAENLHGVIGFAAPGGKAGLFIGDVQITGSLSKASGTFVQPHARDATKEIVYAFFEGPEHAVFLRGTAELKDGTAVIDLPEYFSIVAAEEGVQVQVTPNYTDTYRPCRCGKGSGEDSS